MARLQAESDRMQDECKEIGSAVELQREATELRGEVSQLAMALTKSEADLSQSNFEKNRLKGVIVGDNCYGELRKQVEKLQ